MGAEVVVYADDSSLLAVVDREELPLLLELACAFRSLEAFPIKITVVPSENAITPTATKA